MQLQQQVASRPYMGSEIQRICKKKEVCPYELVKAGLSDVKVIALSYLYVFDPVIRTAFLKNLETELQKIILIVDEAHNLPETAIRHLRQHPLAVCYEGGRNGSQPIWHKDIEEFAHFFRTEVEKITDKISREEIIPPNSIIEIIQKQGNIPRPREFFEHMHEAGAAIKKSLLADGKNPRSYVHAMSEFLLKWNDTLEDDSFINVASRYFNKENNKTAKLEIVALDPSKVTQPVFSSTYANVIMSGTLQPLEAFARITRLPREHREVSCALAVSKRTRVLSGLSVALQLQWRKEPLKCTKPWLNA